MTRAASVTCMTAGVTPAARTTTNDRTTVNPGPATATTEARTVTVTVTTTATATATATVTANATANMTATATATVTVTVTVTWGVSVTVGMTTTETTCVTLTMTIARDPTTSAITAFARTVVVAVSLQVGGGQTVRNWADLLARHPYAPRPAALVLAKLEGWCDIHHVKKHDTRDCVDLQATTAKYGPAPWLSGNGPRD